MFHNFLLFDRSQVIEVREKGVLVPRSIACAKLSVIAKKIGWEANKRESEKGREERRREPVSMGGGGGERRGTWWKRRKRFFKSEENNDQVHKQKKNFVLTC